MHQIVVDFNSQRQKSGVANKDNEDGVAGTAPGESVSVKWA